MLMTDHTAVTNSSAITDVWYNKDNYTLVVKFVGGNYAGYSNIAPYTYRSMIESDSVGSFYNTRVKHYYSGLSVNSVEMPNQPEVQSAVASGSKFVVKANVSGTITMTLDASDVESAIVLFQEAVSDALGDDPTFTVSLESVNPA